MFGWLKKKTLADVRGAPAEEPMVHYVHARQRMPDEGAQSYAFETLQLAVHSPIDRAVRVRKNIGVAFPQLEGQVWIAPAVRTNGIPSMAGAIYGARQFNTDGSMADLGSLEVIDQFALRWNNPNMRAVDISNAVSSNNPSPFKVQL